MITFLINRWTPINRLDFREILLIRLDHLGDLVWCLESIRNLRGHFPTARITALIGEWNLEFFKGSPDVDEVLIYNSPAFTRSRPRITSRRQRLRILRRLRSERYDLVIGFRDDAFTIGASLLICPRARVDRGTTRIRKKLYPRLRAVTWHESDTNAAIVAPVLRARHAPGRGSAIERLLFFSEEEDQWLNEFLHKHRMRRKMFAILHPGAAWPYRRWNPANFSRVAAFLYERYGLKSIVLGTRDESDVGARVIGDRPALFVNATGETTLRQMMLLISQARIAVCNDSGPAHLSAILRTPTIVLLGPEDVARFAPRGSQIICFHKKLECHPCAQVTCKYPENPCVNLNTVEEILQAIPELMGTRS